jgi:hypothetical protein
MDTQPGKKINIDLKAENNKELRKSLQLRDDGISYDYWNTAVSAHLCCNWLMDKSSDMNSEKTRALLAESLKEYISYSEYLYLEDNSKGAQFITPDGREIQKRLDSLAGDIKAFANQDPKSMDIVRLSKLLEEVRQIIYEKQIRESKGL